MESEYSPYTTHLYRLKSILPELTYRSDLDIPEWRVLVAQKFRGLLGEMPEQVSPDLLVQATRVFPDYTDRYITFRTEDHCRAAAHLLVPSGVRGPVPVVICLQGHSSGMHLSLGRAKTLKDRVLIRLGHRDIAIQAIRNGFAALALEQRCFGVRRDDRPQEYRQNRHTCHHTTLTALLLGRTMAGERVWDVMRAVDVLSHFPELDSSRIACVGHSAGGTIAYYAACLDDRIKGVVSSCCVCGYVESIGTRDHCMDNYIPGILKSFDMGDLSCLIAPRPLICVAGRCDRIFPLDGVQKAYSVIGDIYRAAGHENACRLQIGSGGHHFYPGLVWPLFREMTGW